MAKGSGMIEPQDGDDARRASRPTSQIAPPLLARALADACDETFNAITVDGECSTNDCVFVLANGASGVTIGEPQYDLFVGALREVALELALGIVRGGEGATKLVMVRVGGAASTRGRAACRARHRQFSARQDRGSRRRSQLGPPRGGRPGDRARPSSCRARRSGSETSSCSPTGGRSMSARRTRPTHLAGRDVLIYVDLGAGGRHDATMWTCDLSAEYVRINADYRT